MRAILMMVMVGVTGVLSFWAGHAHSEYRAQQVLSEVSRSSALTGPETAIRCAEFTEKRGADEASSRMREIARNMFNTPTPRLGQSSPTGWLSAPTFGSVPGLDALRETNDKRESVLREKLTAR
jgi:hypothetical protein